jgi:signal transduction histidine kinase
MISLDLPQITLLIAGLFSALTFVVALLRRRQHPQAAQALIGYTFAMSIWVCWLAAWQAGLLSFLDAGFLSRIPFYGLFILSVGYYFLTRGFLGVTRHWQYWALLAVVWLGILVTLDSNWLGLEEIWLARDGWSITRTRVALACIVIGWALYTGSAAILTLRTYRKVKPSFYRNRITYWVLVLIIIAFGGVVILSGNLVPGVVLQVLGVMFAVYSLLTTALPNVPSLAFRMASSTLMIGISLGLYLLTFLGIDVLLRDYPFYSPIWVGLALALVLAIVVNPILRSINKQIERTVEGEDLDVTRILSRYSQSITNILDLELLASVAITSIGDVLDVQGGYLFLVDFEKDNSGRSFFRLRGESSEAEASPAPAELAINSPITQYFQQENWPLSEYDLEIQPRFASASWNERVWFSQLDMEVYIPIFSKNEWIGLLALGPKTSGEPYWESQWGLLSALADQTAIALENVRLVEGLMRLNTEFQRSYAALDQANRHLERLERTKSDFISIASHEIRTPLTLISGSAQMLYDEKALHGDDYYKTLLEKIQSGSHRLEEIVDSMFDMAKVDARDLQLDPQPIALASLFRTLAARLESALKDRQQTLELQDGLGNLPPIEADLESLGKAFRHLLVNAIKYTPDGGKIRVYGKILEPDEGELTEASVEIIVEDNGIGISPQYHELIFTKFYQTGELAYHSSGETKFKGGGPGLGLAITKGIIEAHRGRIWVESLGYNEETRPGSQFHVLLPIQQPKAAVPPEGLFH